MNRMLVGIGLMSLACLLGAAGCATDEAARQSASASSSGGASDELADSLKACLARIPSGSSAGAKMVAEQSCRENETHRLNVVGSATTKSGDRASAGTQGDSLEACMSRIPSSATAGQRMLAEESCKRDQLSHR